MIMDLFLKVDEYLSKPLEDIKASFSGSRGYAFRWAILNYPADFRFNRLQIYQELNNVIQNACIFYDNWLKIFKESPGFFVEHHKSSDFEKIVDNIGNKNKAIIQSFQSDIGEMVNMKMEQENLTQVERDILVGWLTEFLQSRSW